MAIYSMGRRRVIALLVLTSIMLITLDTRGNAVIDRARSVFALILEPFDAAARTISRPVLNAWEGIVHYDDLQRENEALRAEIDNQRGAEIEARAAILEYQELLTLNRLLGSGSYPTVTAQVQGQAPGNFQYTVEINKGSTDGIQVGMPVVNGAGLVGKITRVFPNSSLVLLVIDPDFSIGAKVLTEAESAPLVTVAEETETGSATTVDPAATGGPTATTVDAAATTTTVAATTTTAFDPSPGPLDPVDLDTTTTSSSVAPLFTTTTAAPVEIIRETGQLSGQGAGQPLVLRFVDDSSTSGRVKVGSTVQTAGGTGSIAPAGLPIGEVSAVKEQTGSRSLLVEVTLAAGDLSKLNFVRVLLYVPNTSGN